MAKRYVVIDAHEAGELYDEEYLDYEPDEGRVLVDTQRGVVLYFENDDIDSPEDMYLNRDLRVFVTELNRLAEEG